MRSTVLDALKDRVRGPVETDAPLAHRTTYRLGGPAALLVEPVDAEDAAAALHVARDADLPWLVLGLGSNVLVRDSGFAGLVLVIGKAMSGLEYSAADGVWRVGAGMPTPLLARRTARAGFGGVHRLIGVPGTMGGGIYMNAGAHGQEFREVARDVELMSAAGEVERRSGDDIPWAYRASNLGAVVVLSARIALVPGDPKRLQAEIREHFRWRRAGTPFNQPCCGSVFRNPAPPDPAAARRGERSTAGQLIEAAGMKGFRIGGAEVSRMHANYIVNTGDATADDVLRVIDAVRERVHEVFGTELILEVKVIG